jgi:hypothetical protein
LNRGTLDFICNGAAQGQRSSRLFCAAANLGEFDCPIELAHALLSESGLDSGLPPREVRQQIDCGLDHARQRVGSDHGSATPQNASESPHDASDDTKDRERPEGDPSDSGGFNWQTGQQLTPTTKLTPNDDTSEKIALARLWGRIRQPRPVGACTPPEIESSSLLAAEIVIPERSDLAARAAVIRDLEPPLPVGAVSTGKLNNPCRCGSREYLEMAIPEDRTRLDCRSCGRFIDWGKWHSTGKATS